MQRIKKAIRRSTDARIWDGCYLDDVYRKARNIILEVAAMEEHQNMQQELGVSSADIDTLIRHARKAKTKKEVKQFFDMAADKLSEDIRSVLQVLKCN